MQPRADGRPPAAAISAPVSRKPRADFFKWLRNSGPEIMPTAAVKHTSPSSRMTEGSSIPKCPSTRAASSTPEAPRLIPPTRMEPAA